MKRALAYLVPLTLLPVLAITTPLPTPLACPLAAWANTIRTFGQDGYRGREGREGRPGTTGPSQTIQAEGQPQQLYLGGGDGGGGEDGGRGERSRNCQNQPRDTRHDLQACPSGGDGGQRRWTAVTGAMAAH
ncbi:MAG: hypothetical protein HC812_05865 [Leptolyngbya sp. RL_3_1]|nr:hypothetical protein [Leptolyngbya sp. RL_3_1]